MPSDSPLTPRLVVRDSAAAIAFYQAAFGAEEIERFTDPSGAIVHAAVRIEGAVVAVTDENPDSHNDSPESLGGSPVILSLRCDDPDALAAGAVEHGARVIFPMGDRFYGARDGRIEDPFGHVWILTRPLDEAPDEAEIQRRLDGQ